MYIYYKTAVTLDYMYSITKFQIKMNDLLLGNQVFKPVFTCF